MFRSWTHIHFPTYFFPLETIEELVGWYTKEEESDDITTTLTIWLGEDPKAVKSLTVYRSGPLEGLASIKFDAMDAWFEEDEQVYIHPKDPYKVCTSILRLSHKI